MNAVETASVDHAIFANVFFPTIEVDFALRALGADASTAEREGVAGDIKATLAERMSERNRWGCDLVADDPRFSVLAGIDPSVLPPDETAAFVEGLGQSGRIRGIKIHPAIQDFWPNDPRLGPTYRVCEELGLSVLSHSGSVHGEEQRGAPSCFGPVLRTFPRLKLQVAHLGGGEWREAVALAEAFEQVVFDVCEIIDWAGSPNAPTRSDLALMIKGIGPNRILFGTDFPWYDLDRTVEKVEQLPGLSAGEKEAILGLNAAEFYGLPL